MLCQLKVISNIHVSSIHQWNLNNFQEFSTMAQEDFSKHVFIYKKKIQHDHDNS